MNVGGEHARATDVGILAMEVYVPNYVVPQAALEQVQGLEGKYTRGLGQEGLGYCSDREDVVSMAMTVLQRLMEKYELDAGTIGRLDVGTETPIDRSKSIKSHLMQIMQEHTDVEGSDHIHACYGGTAALFDAMNWVESSHWDGRLAVVVASDVALYPPDSVARATGGCGAVALLVGPSAPLVFDPGWRSTYCQHCYDFYKPQGQPVYPVVDGPATVYWFMRALDGCYARLYQSLTKRGLQPAGQGLLDQVNFFVSHAPYNKIVRKSFARMKLQDRLRGRQEQEGLLAWCSSWDPNDLPGVSYQDKDVDRLIVGLTRQEEYNEKVAPGTWVQQAVGNMYTASVYSGLAALVEARGEGLQGRRVLVYSYGSGVMASMFALVGRKVEGRFSLASMQCKLDLARSLKCRIVTDPDHFHSAMQQLEDITGKSCVEPAGRVDDLADGTFYLQGIDCKYRRTYCRKAPRKAIGDRAPDTS